jgi:thioredoxin 1
MADNVKTVSEKEFKANVLDAARPVLVDFWAVWCGPCKMIAPLLDTLAGEFNGRVKVVKVNVDDAADLANQYRITGVPTLMLFKNGEVADTIVGAPSAKALRTKLESAAAAK